MHVMRRARSRLYWSVKSRFGDVPAAIRLNADEWDAAYAAGSVARA